MMRALSPLLLFALAGCVPDLGPPESLVAGPRILAVQADPPESKPKEKVGYRALVITPAGTVHDTSAAWAFCASPRPSAVDGSVSPACLGDAVRPIAGAGLSITAPTPADACAVFGPDPPPGDLRPRDPDVTGGYYQPVRLEALGLTAFALGRITCDLPNAPVAAAIELQKRYVANHNPHLGALTAGVSGAPVALDAIPAGADVHFQIAWDAADAETYALYDPASQQIVDRRESLRVAWLATAGALAAGVTGRAEDDAETTTENTWTAPAEAGAVHLWLVLRDSRGGVDFTERELGVAR